MNLGNRFDNWGDKINSVSKETPKMRFIKTNTCAQANKTFEAKGSTNSLKCITSKHNKKTTEQNDNVNRFKALNKMKELRQVNKLSYVLSQYNKTVDNQQLEDKEDAELYVYNNDHIKPHIAVKNYDDFVSSRSQDPVLKLRLHQNKNREKGIKTKPPREQQSRELFFSRIADGQLKVKNGVIVNYPGHRVVLNRRKRFMKLIAEAKATSKAMATNANMIALSTKHSNNENSYALGQLSRQPLVRFNNEMDKVNKLKKNVQLFNDNSMDRNRCAKNIHSKINNYNCLQRQNNMKKKHKDQNNCRNIVTKSQINFTESIVTNHSNVESKDGKKSFSKSYKEFHRKWNTPLSKRDVGERIDVGIFDDNFTSLMNQPSKKISHLKPSHLDNCKMKNQKAAKCKYSLDTLQISDSFLKNLNLTRRQWKKTPILQKIAYIKTENIINEVISLRNKTAIQPKLSLF